MCFLIIMNYYNQCLATFGVKVKVWVKIQNDYQKDSDSRLTFSVSFDFDGDSENTDFRLWYIQFWFKIYSEVSTEYPEFSDFNPHQGNVAIIGIFGKKEYNSSST